MNYINRTEDIKVPNLRRLTFLEDLLYHHQSVKKKDELGVRLYEEAIDAYLHSGRVHVGKSGYLLNRLHPRGKWSSYYSKVHQRGKKTKTEHHLVLYFRNRPEEIVLATEGFALGVKDEVKVHLCGSVTAFDDWVETIVVQEQIKLIGLLMSKITASTPLRELPVLIRKCLLKAIGRFLMGMGPSLEPDEVILLRSLLKANGILDLHKVF